MKNPGIYILTSPSGNQYVGYDSNLPKRVKQHLSGKDKKCPAIHNAIQKYGGNAFDVEIIHYPHISLDALRAVEEWKIKHLCTKKPHGYNLTDGGDGTTGLKHSDEARQKMSEIRLKNLQKNPPPNNTGKKRSPHSEEARRKIGDKNWKRRRRLKAEWMWVRSLAMFWYESHLYVTKRRAKFFDKEIPNTSEAEQSTLF